MLAEGETSFTLTAPHLARMNLHFSETLTLYTNGNVQLAEDIKAALIQSTEALMYVESRHIVKSMKSLKGSEITIHFDDGSQKTERFLAHKPKTALKGDLHEQAWS